MDKDITFKAEDGKTIYCTLSSHTGKKCRGLIIYAHGLPCSRHEYPYVISARKFAKLGYDALRISFYSWEKNARNLKDCGFAEHVADLEAVIKASKRKYKNIYLIGHSWGGPTIMLTGCQHVKAVSLWDPSYNVPFWWDDCVRREGKNLFMTGSADVLLSTRMHNEARSLDMKRCRDLSAAFTCPIQVIHAGKGSFLYKFKETYHTNASGPTDYHLVKKADHMFIDDEPLDEAIRHTHNWFKKFAS